MRKISPKSITVIVGVLFVLLAGIAAHGVISKRPDFLVDWRHVGTMYEYRGRMVTVYWHEEIPMRTAAYLSPRIQWEYKEEELGFWMQRWNGKEAYVLEDSYWASETPYSSDAERVSVFLYHFRPATRVERGTYEMRKFLGLKLTPFQLSTRIYIFGGGID